MPNHVLQREEVLTHKDVILLMDAKAGKAPVMFGTLIELGKQCVSKLPKDRPEMTDVWKQLDQHPIASAQGASTLSLFYIEPAYIEIPLISNFFPVPWIVLCITNSRIYRIFPAVPRHSI